MDSVITICPNVPLGHKNECKELVHHVKTIFGYVVLLYQWNMSEDCKSNCKLHLMQKLLTVFHEKYPCL